MNNVEDNKKEINSIIADLRETVNPEMCRCFVDVFLNCQQNLEVRWCPTLETILFLVIILIQL